MEPLLKKKKKQKNKTKKIYKEPNYKFKYYVFLKKMEVFSFG